MDNSHTAAIAPSDEQAVPEALAALRGAGDGRVVVRGAGMHGAVVPEGAPTLSLTRLAQVRDVDTRAGVVLTEAGVTVQALERVLKAEGLTLGHLGPLPAAATIGGLLGRAWPASPSWYRADLPGVCAGLRAVRFDGAAYAYSPAPRKSSGPDLRGLFIGAQGQHGVITAAYLSASPLPEVQITLRALLAAGDGGPLLDGMFAAVRAGAQPQSASLWVSADGCDLRMTFAGVAPLVRALVDLASESVRAAAPAAEITQAQGDLDALAAFALDGSPSDIARVALEDTLYAPSRAPAWAIASGHGHLPTLRAALAAAQSATLNQPDLCALITQPSPTDASALLMRRAPGGPTDLAAVTAWRALPWLWALNPPAPPVASAADAASDEGAPAWLRRWRAISPTRP